MSSLFFPLDSDGFPRPLPACEDAHQLLKSCCSCNEENCNGKSCSERPLAVMAAPEGMCTKSGACFSWRAGFPHYLDVSATRVEITRRVWSHINHAVTHVQVHSRDKSSHQRTLMLRGWQLVSSLTEPQWYLSHTDCGTLYFSTLLAEHFW